MENILKQSLFFLFFLLFVSVWKMSSAVPDTVRESVPSFHASTECIIDSPEDAFSATMEYLLDCGKACITQCACDDPVFSLDSLKFIADMIGATAMSDVRSHYTDLQPAVSSCRIVRYDSADYYVYMLERIIV